MHSITSRAIALIAAALTSNLGITASAQSYTFTKVADSDGPYGTFGGGPSISPSGIVVFGANLDPGERAEGGLFTSDDGALTTIALTNPPFLFFHGFERVNASGTVAFHAELDSGARGIFIGNGGATTTIADNTGEFAAFSDFLSIDDAGNVVFRASLDNGEFSIFTGNGGEITTIADATGEFSFFAPPASNSNGDVVFVGFMDDGSHGVLSAAAANSHRSPMTADRSTPSSASVSQ